MIWAGSSFRHKERRERLGKRIRIVSSLASVWRRTYEEEPCLLSASFPRDLQLMKLGCSRVACQINMSLTLPHIEIYVRACTYARVFHPSLLPSFPEDESGRFDPRNRGFCLSSRHCGNQNPRVGCFLDASSSSSCLNYALYKF